MGVAIGIDLGTTNTVVAAVVDGVAVTLEDESKRRLIPSVVSFHPSGNVLVGEAARERRVIDPENTIYSVKRLIGRPYGAPEVQGSLSKFPFRIEEGAKNTTMVVARGVAYALPEISAFVLRRAKAIAEAALGEPVEKAVITVPANFNDLQRASTKVAGKLAGLEVLRILNEPTAAALAYGQSIAEAERIVVYDLGGGTFDITLLDLSGSVFEVLSTAGDSSLGGDDIDALIAERIATEVMRVHRFDPRTHYATIARLRLVAESIKRELSAQSETTVDIQEIGYGAGGGALSIKFKMTRGELEAMVAPLVARTMDVMRQSVDASGLKPNAFDRILLVGGSTRMPFVGKRVEEYFGQPPHLRVNPDEVVALGAAIQAYSLNKSRSVVRARREPLPTLPEMPAATGYSIATPGSPRSKIALDDTPAVSLPLVTATAAPALPGARGAGTVRMAEAPPRAPDLPLVVGKGVVPAPSRAAVSKAPEVRPRALSRPDEAEVDLARTRENEVVPPREALPSVSGLVRQPDGSYALMEDDEDDGGLPGAPFGETPTLLSAAPVTRAEPEIPAPDDSDSSMPAVLFGEVQQLPGRAEHIAALDLRADPEPAVPTAFAAKATRPTADVPARFPSARPDPIALLQASLADAARGSAIATRSEAPLLIDVTPLSLRVETVGGYSDVLIAANSPVPCDRTRVFLTATDRQTSVYIRVAQGESRRFSENTSLGELELSGLPPKARGELQISVTFELDADGILNVRATDTGTGRQTEATLRLLGLSTDEGDVAAMLARQGQTEVV